MLALPLVADPATAACAGCPAPCCSGHDVPLDGHDLARLLAGLGVPWAAIAEVEVERTCLGGGFRLDRGAAHHRLRLRRHMDGACTFLLQLDGGHRRCGVHALRPGACRAYPLHLDGDGGAALGGHAMCPEERAARYQAAAPALRPLLDEDAREAGLWGEVLARWDQLARHVPEERALAVDDFVTWVCGLDASLEPLRASGTPGWVERAVVRIREHPLPSAGTMA